MIVPILLILWLVIELACAPRGREDRNGFSVVGYFENFFSKRKETMNIIAKLKCSKLESNGPEKSYESVTLDAVYSEDKTSENYSFSQATPFAHLQMSISNPGAFDFFIEGQEYRVTFEKAK